MDIPTSENFQPQMPLATPPDHRLRNTLGGIALVLVLAGGFFLINRERAEENPVNDREQAALGSYVRRAGQDIKVEIADEAEEQIEGLSGREGLGENEGMLFVFENPGRYSFWMKDMNFPIDIIWLDAGMKVIYIKEDARPEDGEANFGPDTESKYVLEAPAGLAAGSGGKV